MVVRDLNIERIAIFPSKANAILVIDPYAKLSRAVAFQRLQPVGGGRCKVAKLLGVIDLHQTSQRDNGDLLETPDANLSKDCFCVPVTK